MDNVEKKKWRKQVKICEKLGAKKFQKYVFWLEDVKFKVSKKIFPNYLSKYERTCDKERNALLKKAKTEEEKRDIIRKYKFAKMAARKEYYLEQNANYHMDFSNPTAMYHYLNWNKKIHKYGIIKNIMAISLLALLLASGFSWTIPLLVYEGFCTFINFECINIQNYNIGRVKLTEERLVKRAKKELEEDIENYSNGAQVINACMKEKEKEIIKSVGNNELPKNDIPTVDDIVGKVETLAQAQELKALAMREIERRKQQKERKMEGKKCK